MQTELCSNRGKPFYSYVWLFASGVFEMKVRLWLTSITAWFSGDEESMLARLYISIADAKLSTRLTGTVRKLLR